MRTAIILVGGVVLAGAANAAGINLYWDDCGAGGGVANKTFACNTNVGYHELYVSVDPPPGVVATDGHRQVLAIQSEQGSLPLWWEFKNTGTCRTTSLLGSADFSTGLSGGQGCTDPWGGQGMMSGPLGVAEYTMSFGGYPCLTRLIGSVSVMPDLAAPMTPGTEYYSGKFRIVNAKTVGAGVCGGCSEPVCLVLNQVLIFQPAPNASFAIESPRDNYFASWQHTSWCYPASDGGPPRCEPSPTYVRAWGQVKSLYR